MESTVNMCSYIFISWGKIQYLPGLWLMMTEFSSHESYPTFLQSTDHNLFSPLNPFNIHSYFQCLATALLDCLIIIIMVINSIFSRWSCDHLFEVTFSPWRIAIAVLTIQPAASISLFLFSCTSSLQLGSMNFSSEKCAVCNGSKTELWKFWRLSISISHWEQTKELSWRERNFLFEM